MATSTGGDGRGPSPLPERLSRILTERNFLACLTVAFIAMTVWVGTVPYDPMRDIADATTNVIWSEYYRDGEFAVPYAQWKADGRPMTQSSVVLLDGEPWVVNEKGPAHALIELVLGPAIGTVLAAVGVAATYMLGRRLFGWQVGAIASVVVLTNLTTIALWYRHMWVDASTMPLLALSMWLFVESVARMRADIGAHARGGPMPAVVLGACGGLAFGVAIATRYTVGVVLLAVLVYVLALYWRPLAESLRGRDARLLARTAGRAMLLLLPFILGMLVVLLPLMHYNATYFGGPLHSGYDATSLMDYERSRGVIDARNQTEQLFMDPLDKVENIVHNTFTLAPLILSRMLALVFVPYGVWRLRRDPSMWLLLPWAATIMVGFLAIEWIDMYSRALDVVWEPRYHLPALPAIALMAGVALRRAGEGSAGPVAAGGHPRGSAALALTIVVMIALSGVLPAEANFAEVRSSGVPTEQGGQQQQPADKPTVVVVARLYAEAVQLQDRPVELHGGRVVSVQRAGGTGPVVAFQLRDASSPLDLTVRLVDFPPGTTPDLRTGQNVSVFGLSAWPDPDGDGVVDPGEPLVRIRSGTPDRVVIEA